MKEILCHYRTCEKRATTKHPRFNIPVCKAHAAPQYSDRDFVGMRREGNLAGLGIRSISKGRGKLTKWSTMRDYAPEENGPVTVRKLEP